MEMEAFCFAASRRENTTFSLDSAIAPALSSAQGSIDLSKHHFGRGVSRVTESAFRIGCRDRLADIGRCVMADAEEAPTVGAGDRPLSVTFMSIPLKHELLRDPGSFRENTYPFELGQRIRVDVDAVEFGETFGD